MAVEWGSSTQPFFSGIAAVDVLPELACDALTIEEGDFTIAIIPDPQRYAANPALFATYYAQTQWVADNAEALNIQLVLNVGDVVDEGGVKPEQFDIADAAWQTIDDTGIPYVISVGNHDYDDDCKTLPESTRGLSYFNSYFGPSRFEAADWWDGGFYEDGKAENSYLLLTIAGVDYIILNLEFVPRAAIVAWANDVLDFYVNRTAIIMTHSYLDYTGLYVSTSGAYNMPGDDYTDGQALWDDLIKTKPNVILVVSGHVVGDGNDARMDVGISGNRINQIVTNFQSPIEPNGGNGWLRVAIVRPSQNKIFMRTYSVTLDAFKTTSDFCFDLTY